MYLWFRVGRFRRALHWLCVIAMGFSVAPAAAETGVADNAWDAPRKVVVFLQGVCTQLGGPEPSDTFGDLKELLRRPIAQGGYGYGAGDLMMYSYKGGAVFPDGVWHPNAYGPRDPIEQSIGGASLDALHEQLLLPYKAHHRNVTFVL